MAGQITLFADLEARQDEVLRQLEALDRRLEHALKQVGVVQPPTSPDALANGKSGSPDQSGRSEPGAPDQSGRGEPGAPDQSGRGEPKAPGQSRSKNKSAQPVKLRLVRQNGSVIDAKTIA